jgi:hypothetical protein
MLKSRLYSEVGSDSFQAGSSPKLPPSRMHAWILLIRGGTRRSINQFVAEPAGEDG